MKTPETANLRRPRRLGLPAVLLLCLGCLRFPFWASAQADTSIYEPYSITTLAGLALNSGSTDNTGNLARFNRPYGVAVDGFGTVYVGDTGNHSIRKITSGGAVTLLAGIPGTSGSANGANLGAMFSNPTGVAVDSTGNVYVADYNNHLIRQISGGTVSTLAGSVGVAGIADGTGTAAQFRNPFGVAVNSAGTVVYVSDMNNQTIRKITVPGGVVTTLTGSPNVNGSTDGPNNVALFNTPRGIAVDSGGNIFVSDSGNLTVRKILSGGGVSTLAGAVFTPGFNDGPGLGARFSILQAISPFGGPCGVAVDAIGNVYVADQGSTGAGYTIRKITPGLSVTTLAGSVGVAGSTDATGIAVGFNLPAGVAVDSAGKIYVADTVNHTIRVGVDTNCGNSVPVITCPTNKMVNCGTDWTFDAPIATSACGTNLTVSVLHTVTNTGPCSTVITRTWQATSCFGAGMKSWSPLGAGLNGEVWALTEMGGNLYVGGQFTTAGGASANYIAKWNGTSWSQLGSGITNGLNGGVYALAVMGGKLFAAGYFTTAGGVTATNIAQWDGTSWSPLGTGLVAYSAVEALAVIGTDLYVGGGFSTADGGPGNLIAKYNTLTSVWSPLGSGMNDRVNSLTVVGTDLYAGGQFTSAGGVSANFVAKWNGSNWSALGTGMDLSVGGSLGVLGGNLYAGGVFTSAGGNSANRVAKWDIANSIWSSVGTGINNGMNDGVEGFAVMGTDLYASGGFMTAGGVSANRVAQWNGSTWSPLGTGMNNGVWRLAAIGQNLYAGGIFTTAGGLSANYIAKWGADCIPISVTCSQTVTIVDTTPPVFTCTNPSVASFSAGTTSDNFVGPEPASPSAGLILRLQSNGVSSLKGFDDNCAINTFFAHTFTNLPLCITKATLSVRLKGCSSSQTYNDSFGLSFTFPSGALVPTSWSRYLGSHNSNPATGLFTDFDSGTTLDVVLDLSQLPNVDGSTTDLIPTLNVQGFLDLVIQDDSAIDFAVLTVTSCCATETKTVECGTAWTFDAPTVSDSCSGTNVTLTVLSTVTNGVCPRIITRTWKAIDACGNSVTNSQAVTVVDTMPPVLTCATNKTVQCGTAWTFDAPTVSDSCSGTNLTVSILSTVTNGVCPRFITRTWKATDACGNTNTCIQIVTVVDTTPPVLTCATNKTVQCGKAWNFDAPTVSDSCSGTNLTVSILSTVTNGVCPRIITRTWQATDACGNTNTCSQSVTVVDTMPPTIACPGNITRYTCANAIRVYYAAWAVDACSPTVSLSYSPPSGSYFAAGTNTPVTVTATDGCGNTSTCTFQVKVINQNASQILVRGLPDCYNLWVADPAAVRSACLNSSYSPALWNSFDNSTINRRVGVSWQGLPSSITSAQVTTRMKPRKTLFNTPQNDTIAFGLGTCNPASWLWSQSIGTVLGQPWLFQPNCGVTFAFNLQALPPGGGTTSLLPHLNSSSHRLDMLVQNDTVVDYAWMRIRYCAPIIFNGSSVTLGNAIAIATPSGWLLAQDPEVVGATNASAAFALGDTLHARLSLDLAALTQSPQGRLNVSFSATDSEEVVEDFGFQLVSTPRADGPATTWQPVAPSGSSNSRVRLMNAGREVGASSGMKPIQVRGEIPAAEIIFNGGTNVIARFATSVSVGGGAGGPPLLVDAIQFSFDLSTAPDVASTVIVLNLSDLPEVGIRGLASGSARGFDAIQGNVLAQSSGDMIVLSPQDEDSNDPFGVSLSVAPAHEFRAVLGASFDVFAPTSPGSSLALFTRGLVGGQDRELPGLRFDYTKPGWTLAATRDGTPLPLRRAQVWNRGAIVADLMSPISVQWASLPQLHWPSLVGTTDAEIVHRFPSSTAVDVVVDGMTYSGTEVRITTGTFGEPVEALTGLRVEAVRAELLAMSPLDVGAVSYRLEVPESGDDEVTVRWSGVGGVLESASSLDGAWSAVAGSEGGEVTLPVETATARFFRVRGQ